MKNNKIFDLLENAENDSMKRLIDKCPDISDEQLDRILDMSERKYNMRNSGTAGTIGNNNIRMSGNGTVEGVERSKRPVWMTPLRTAASLLLVAGIAVGSIAVIKNNSKMVNNNNNNAVAPVIDTTSTSTETALTTTDANSAVITTIVPVEKPAATTTTTASTESASSDDYAVLDISQIAGDWGYEPPETTDNDESWKHLKGSFRINENGTFTFTPYNFGYEVNGTVKTGYEEIGGTKVPTVSFFGGQDNEELRGYYHEGDPDKITFGNGDAASIVRGKLPVSGLSAIAGEWQYQVAYGNSTVDVSAKNQGSVIINADGTYTYTNYTNGYTTNGTIEIAFEGYADGTPKPMLYFYEGSTFVFAAYYNEDSTDSLYIGNGGTERLYRGSANTAPENDFDMSKIAGTWTYQVAYPNSTVDVYAKNQGVVVINADGTYSYSDNTTGYTTTGTIDVSYEEYVDGTKSPLLNFYEGTEFVFAAYYNEEAPDSLNIGNGGLKRLFRGHI